MSDRWDDSVDELWKLTGEGIFINAPPEVVCYYFAAMSACMEAKGWKARVTELEVDVERLKSERVLMLDFVKWLYIGRLHEIEDHYQKLPDDLKTAIQETMTLENSHDPL